VFVPPSALFQAVMYQRKRHQNNERNAGNNSERKYDTYKEDNGYPLI